MQLPQFPFSAKQVARAARLSVRKTAGKVVAVFTFGSEEEPNRFALQLIATRFGEPAVFVRDADGIEPGTNGHSLIIRQFSTVADYPVA